MERQVAISSPAPPSSSSVSEMGPRNVLLPRHTPLSPLFSALLCNSCSTLRLSLLRNGYAQTSILSRTEVLHSATICRMCKHILRAIERNFDWMKECSHKESPQKENEGPGVGQPSPKSKASTMVDSCTLINPVTVHIRAQAVYPEEHRTSPSANGDAGAVASAGSLGIEVVTFGQADIESLPDQNLCVRHMAERRRTRLQTVKMAPQRRSMTAIMEFSGGDSWVQSTSTVDAAAPTSSAQPPAESTPPSDDSQTYKNRKISRNQVFQSARRWLSDSSRNLPPKTREPSASVPAETPPAPIDPVLKAGLSTFLLDVSNPPEITLLRTEDLIAARGKIPRYVALSHCIDINTGPSQASPRSGKSGRESPIVGPGKWDDLPVFVQHAALSTRALKIRYLWVDHLCSPKRRSSFSKNKHADDLAFIYSGAYVTLAVHSPNSFSGFLGKATGGFQGKAALPLSSLSHSDFLDTVDRRSPLMRTPQGVLSRVCTRNLIHMSPDRIYFEDEQAVRTPVTESVRLRNLGPNVIGIVSRDNSRYAFLGRVSQRDCGMVPMLGNSSHSDHSLPMEWFDTLQRISRCDRVKAGDEKLKVVESLARFMAIPESKFLLGALVSPNEVPREPSTLNFPPSGNNCLVNDFARSLAWKSVSQVSYSSTDNSSIGKPSWAWVKQKGEIEYNDDIIFGRSHPKTAWLLGFDCWERKGPTISDIYENLRSRAVGFDSSALKWEEQHSLGHSRIGSFDSRHASFDLSKLRITSLAMEVGLQGFSESGRLLIAGILIPVRVSKKRWPSKAGMHSRHKTISAHIQTLSDNQKVNSPQLGSPKLGLGLTIPSKPHRHSYSVDQASPAQMSVFPAHLHPPSKTLYRGLSGWLPGGQHEILIGWCAIDEEGESADPVLTHSKQDASPFPPVAVLPLVGSYGILLKRVNPAVTTPSPLAMNLSSLSPASESFASPLPPPSYGNTPSRKCMYSRLASGEVGRTLSLARRREDMEKRERPRDSALSSRGNGSDMSLPEGSAGSCTPSDASGLHSPASQTSFDPGTSTVPSYTRVGFVRLDDRLVDRSLVESSSSSSPSPLPPHPASVSTDDVSSLRVGKLPSFCSGRRSADEMTRGAADYRPGLLPPPPPQPPQSSLPPRKALASPVDELDKMIRNAAEVTVRMKHVGARGSVIALV